MNKTENDWIKDDKENMQLGLKVKAIITIDIGIDELLWVSHYETTKEIWYILQITHEGTTKIKRVRLITLTHEYELYKMRLEENISQMQTPYTHIVSHIEL